MYDQIDYPPRMNAMIRTCRVSPRTASIYIVTLAATIAAAPSCSRPTGANLRIAGAGATVRVEQPFTAEQERTDTFTTGDSPIVTLDLFSGPITVKPAGEAGVTLTVTKRAGGDTQAEADENLKLIDLEVRQEDGKVAVTSRRNSETEFMGFLETAAELEAPPGAVLELSTSFGAVSISSVGASVAVRSANGPIAVHGGTGELNLTSSFGDVSVDGEHAQVEIRTENGQIILAGAKGNVHVSSGFGAIQVLRAAGKIQANTSNGAIKVSGGGGPMELTSSFGDIDVSADDAPVTAKTSNGKITLTGGVEQADLRTDFGPIDVRRTRGRVTAHSSNGAIKVVGGEGPFDVSTDFGDITVGADGAEVVARTMNGKISLTGGKGRLDARSQFGAVDLAASDATVTAHTSNGPIHFAGTLLDGEHQLSSDFGDIAVSLPADSRFRIDAKTDFGRVNCAFDLNQIESSDSHLVGEVGDSARAKLKITTSNGSIEVKRGTK
jgi:DUF4097 and DUF4098 domain-containing protein YvlB